MKNFIGLLTILLVTSSIFGQSGGSDICEFFNVPFTERYQIPHNSNVKFSFEANGKTFMLSYDVDCKKHTNYARSPERIVERNIYLHRLDKDGWEIASDLVKTDFWNKDSRAYDMYYDTRNDLSELIKDTTKASVEVYDNGMVKMKFLSFYGEYNGDRRWKYRWDDVLFLPNGDGTYKVLK